MIGLEVRPIVSPDRRLNALERETECKAALREHFEHLASAAEEAGWTADETALALLRLAGAHVNDRVTEGVALALVRRNQKPFETERRGQRSDE
jgi:hypothetical protein